MNKKEAYEKKLRGKLSEWRADTEKLRAKAEQAEGDAQLAITRSSKNCVPVRRRLAAN